MQHISSDRRLRSHALLAARLFLFLVHAIRIVFNSIYYGLFCFARIQFSTEYKVNLTRLKKFVVNKSVSNCTENYFVIESKAATPDYCDHDQITLKHN